MDGDCVFAAADHDIERRAPAVPGARTVVLVVDADFSRREALAGLIARRGFGVLLARNGEDALARVGRGGAMLVVSSVEMPRMDGLEFLRVMRERQPCIPVVMVASGDGAIDQVYLRGADLLGAARSFTWPLLEDAFLNCLDALSKRV